VSWTVMSSPNQEPPVDAERELIEFETPYVLAEVFPGRVDAPAIMRRCSVTKPPTRS
jgi:hypothetical protein